MRKVSTTTSYPLLEYFTCFYPLTLLKYIVPQIKLQFSGLCHFQWISPLKILTKSSLNQIHSLQHVVRVHNWPFADYGHMVQKTPNWMAKDAERARKTNRLHDLKSKYPFFQGPTASFAIQQGVFCIIWLYFAKGPLSHSKVLSRLSIVSILPEENKPEELLAVLIQSGRK